MARRRNARRPDQVGAGSRRVGKKAPADPSRGLGTLVDAVFARVDPRETAVDLLEGGDKGVKARILSLFLAYKFGKPAQRVEATGPGGGPMRIVVDIPRPAREAKGLP